eukprot:Skav201129  [mRNA]  locus=scaffold4373:183098:184705:+ [translate_table: standard]
MATSAPLLGAEKKKGGHSKASIFYGADEYLEDLLCKTWWNVLTAIFVTQVLMVIGYCAALATFPEYWWTCTLLFGVPFSYIAIQQIYIDHDVMHGATFPVYDFQKFLTHPFADAWLCHRRLLR